MTSLRLAEDPLPNPFAEADSARDKLEQCEIRIDELERINKMLVQSITLLMTLCNKKMTPKKP